MARTIVPGASCATIPLSVDGPRRMWIYLGEDEGRSEDGKGRGEDEDDVAAMYALPLEDIAKRCEKSATHF